MARQIGFYWVRDKNYWYVAEWSGTTWYVTSSEEGFKDRDFDEIDERIIVREPKSI